MKKIRVGIIGYGGIARLHSAAYVRLHEEGYSIRLVAVCDKSIERIKQATDINLGMDSSTLPEEVALYTDIDKMLASEELDLIDICLPSFLHKDVTIKCLSAGKDVLCEKPMALSSEDAKEMVDAAQAKGRVLAIGQCCRFDPVYLYLKDCIADGRFGALRSLTMHRHSVYPSWGADRWHDDKKKCGGCLVDTHIHDVDIARNILGEPQRVCAIVLEDNPKYQYIRSYLEIDGLPVLIDGSWDESYGNTFRAGYHARFERASVECNLGEVRVHPWGEVGFAPKLIDTNSYYNEILHLYRVLAGEEENLASGESAYISMRLIEKIAESAENGGKYLDFNF